ncbi:sulfurtransferase [uncultured Jatrophihabitans sp.]|uniref:sulfurtransferase n=1 Tax=uncultured Jatrophihabitans sp. TaxID=1610747 RepID=UPI0035C9E7AA
MTFGPLVSGEWLAAHLDEVRVVDVRWYLDDRSGRAAFERGHIPGAVWLDIDADLSDDASPRQGRHPLPSPDRFAAALERAGIGPGQAVVAYDDAGGSIAARLWWLLHVLGEPVAVLDGGLDAWPGELSTSDGERPPVRRDRPPWPANRFVDAAQVAAALDTVIYDARTAERYARGDAAIDPRPGHVPGAQSAPWAGNLGPDGRFRPPGELRERFAAAADKPAIAYCGSGVTACHDLLAMEVAGIAGTALYPGSWSQWGADPARPAETS